jgi:hypothetical protein
VRAASGLYDRAVAGVIAAAQRAPIVVLLGALVLAALALTLVARDLGINTSTADMISDRAHFMRVYRELKARFPERSDNLVVVVEADTPDRARDAADLLADRLASDKDRFARVHRPDGGAFLARNGLLYLDVDELLDLLDSLADASPLIQRLRNDTSLRGLFAVLTLAASDAGRLDDLDWLFGRMAAVIEGRLDGRPAQLSWHEIMWGRESEAGDRRAFVIARPVALDYDRLLPGADSLDEVRRVAAEAGLVRENGISVRLTGGLALEYDELATAQRGVALAGLISLVLITAILWWALRALRLVVIALFTLLVGLAWTAGFATLAVGSLNLISVAFAVLFVSLGIDFTLHVCLRVAEVSGQGADPRRAVREGTESVAGSLGLCAASTALGFYAFLPTAYRGVSELGLIAGTGMILALVANLSVLPALLTLWPGRGRRAAVAPVLPRLRVSPRAVRRGAGLALLAAAAALPWARFDFNPMNLQDPEAESVAVLRTLMAEGERDLWAAASVAGTAEEASARARAFEALDLVDRAVWLGSFVPADQEARFEIVQDIAFVMEPDLFAAPYPEPTADEQQGAVAALARALERLQGAGPVPGGGVALARALDRLDAAPPAALELVEEGLVGALPGRLAALEEAARAEPFAIADLPADLVARFRGEDGSFRIDIHPAEDIAADNEALERFVAALRAVDPDVTDDPVIVLEAGRVVVGAFAQALLSALALIALLLYVVTRRLGDLFAVLAPLCLAAALTGAATVVLGLAFNFANVIVLPLLLGIGVDSAIHLVHRHRTDPGRPLLGTSTARAVLFSALTTMAGFGSLALSPHLGTASMGRLLLIGVTLTTACTLVVLPALLSAAGREAAR